LIPVLRLRCLLFDDDELVGLLYLFQLIALQVLRSNQAADGGLVLQASYPGVNKLYRVLLKQIRSIVDISLADPRKRKSEN
jgi:hypothetical protein